MTSTTTVHAEWMPSAAVQEAARTQARLHAELLTRAALLADWAEPASANDRPDELRADRAELAVGDVAVVSGQGRWRYGVVTKVTAAKITVAFLTPGGLDKAQRTWARDSKPLADLDYALTHGVLAYDRALREHAGYARLAARDVDELVAETVSRYPNTSESVREYNERRDRDSHAHAVAWLNRHSDASAYAEPKAVKAYTDAYVRQAAAAAMNRSPWAVNAALAASPRDRAKVWKSATQN